MNDTPNLAEIYLSCSMMVVEIAPRLVISRVFFSINILGVEWDFCVVEVSNHSKNRI